MTLMKAVRLRTVKLQAIKLNHEQKGHNIVTFSPWNSAMQLTIGLSFVVRNVNLHSNL